MILVSESGEVDGAKPLSGDPALRDVALDAAKRWKFKPFLKNGNPVPAVAKITFRFGAESEPTDNNEPTSWIVKSQVSNASVMPSAVRVSQGVTQGLLVKKVAPNYPKAARKARIEGSVILAAVISREGVIKDIKVVSGPPELVDAAVDAVRQWVFRPYIFINRPIEVDTQITINFALSGG